MTLFGRTSAVVEKSLQDLRRLLFVVAIIVQVVFLGLYGFKIYVNWTKLPFLIIYSVLAGLSLFGFVFYLFTFKQKSRLAIKRTKRGIRIAKYLANAATVVVVLVQFALGQASDLDIVLSGVTLAFFGAEVLLEVFRIFYERYSELLLIAINKDLEAFSLLRDPKGGLLDLVDSPLQKLSDKLNGTAPLEEPLTPKEAEVETLTQERNARVNEKKDDHSAEKKGQIKEHLKGIVTGIKSKFKKKDPSTKE
jgi:hypothetical protein